MTTTQQRISSVDRRQQILGIATEMFAEKGFGGTTTREIAAHAQVNEALIFRHFPTKEELYWAVLEAKVRSEDFHLRLEELLSGAANVREALLAVADWTLQRRAEDHATTRLSMFCALERHELSQRFFGHFIAEYFEVLANYLRRQMCQGVLRSADPIMAARTFIGAVVYHSLIQELFGPVDTTGNTDAREASRLMVSIWLDGMSAESPSRHSGAVAKLKNKGTSPKRTSRKALRQAPTEIQEPTQ
ncbi:MAG: TetR/AcrR family transcriptional regulator [Candidatus Korobacteraceae bacterium]|jgi:AcrR family transcriptional regulator